MNSAKAVTINLRNNSISFFQEVISSLCFQGDELPEDSLMDYLMSMLYKAGKTHTISPFTNDEGDDFPTIHSYLLQLFLNFR